jgi:hypothetical protein
MYTKVVQIKPIHVFRWALVVQWFQQQPREFFMKGILQLVRQWDVDLSAHGDCF